MNFVAEIDVMPLKEILDPQGKAVKASFNNLNVAGVEDVRIGKHITIQLEAASKEEATQKVETACRKLLANPIMEYFEFEVKEKS
jgi:phosphoribosylformylglycinamidine synthase subunit PurS